MARVVLHRCPTPTNWLCRCGTVARTLKREGMAFEERRVALRRRDRPEIEALTGQSVVPVLEIGGQVITDSRRIVEHLEWRSERAAARRGTAASKG